MRFVTITSGKGGVGKSTIAANIAYLLSKYGYKVAIFDADIGLANQDIILNVKPQHTILDVLKGKVRFSDAIVPINDNLFLIPGESGEEILSFDNEALLEEFYKGLEQFKDLDFLIIDTGAGIGESVQSFVRASTDTVIITIPDPSAIMDAYSMIKYCSRVKKSVSIVLNQVKSKKEALILFNKLDSVATKHLEKSIDLKLLGFIQKSSIVEEATKTRKLVAKEFITSLPAIQMGEIAKRLTDSVAKDGTKIKENTNIAVFFKRLLQKF
ncbi:MULTISPECIES: P-loop NTPase [unclassified Nitratiruptor]|uniref:P-loop NTPase n=1 Tax=unclassified Nitratiruptor TaxID=2624044 RepID=UPI001915DCFC|nr:MULTISPECIES: P-loop NTPase [unclassified Nitratiruptor]BCD59773.1 flagellar biosynthesis protein FlhG [Nitratiruptor sp. YY08-10]BCD63697.1 flagellar biosynthesis protein FlhG [Nitratiruptor sp. YY08-14]